MLENEGTFRRILSLLGMAALNDIFLQKKTTNERVSLSFSMCMHMHVKIYFYNNKYTHFFCNRAI